MVRECAPARPCPACLGRGWRYGADRAMHVCECVIFPAYMALEWGPALPEYPPPQYDTCEEVEDA